MAAARYTGTDVTTILKMEAITDPEKAVRVTEQEFKKRYGQIRFSSYGFDNTFVFLVKKETAEKY
ncbi:MAG TPA: osmoprotectant ABC transporter substrate-binding protein, partial [Tetragenococcus sp.]|nr:osmoprotectant ABC transporter substrate-binding protein [Tetragenococcus sp.]